jgi:hypothetical protein
MKGIRLKEGDGLQVGDVLVRKTRFGTSIFPVVRITKKYAFVRYNDVSEGKYPNVYERFGFGPRLSETLRISEYYVLRPIKD